MRFGPPDCQKINRKMTPVAPLGYGRDRDSAAAKVPGWQAHSSSDNLQEDNAMPAC